MPVVNVEDLVAFRKFIQACIDDNYYTDDVPLLLQQKTHLLFTYGTLKTGFSRHDALIRKGSPNQAIAPAYTKSNDYCMFRLIGKVGFPFILPALNKQVNGGHIEGELYEVDAQTIFHLDFIESNGSMFQRVRMPIVALMGPDRVPTETYAWAYVGLRPYFNEHINKHKAVLCDKLTRKKDPNFKYYTFMRKYVQ